MRRLLAAAALCALPALASAARPMPHPIAVERLDNGLTVVTVPFDAPGLVAYYTLVRVGSRNEVEPGHSGFAHFFEHMMFRGTKTRSAEDYNRTVKALGFDGNAFTTDDITVYTLFGPKAGLETIVELEADRFQNLAYGEPEFQTEALAVLGEYNKSFSNPVNKLEEVLVGTAFERHTYRHTTMGFLADIREMPKRYEYSKQFFRRWYTPDNTTLFVVGDFDRAALLAAVKQRYGGWKGVAATPKLAVEPPQRKARAASVPWPSETHPRTMVGFHTPPTRDDALDGAIQSLLGAYLFGPTSPLYQRLVLEEQLAEALSPLYTEHRDPHLFAYLLVGKKPEHMAAIEAGADAAIAELRAGKVDAKRLADIQSNSRYGLSLSLETASQLALQLAWYAGPTGNPDSLNLLYENMARVTPDDLVRFAKAHLVDGNRTVVRLAAGKGSR